MVSTITHLHFNFYESFKKSITLIDGNMKYNAARNLIHGNTKYNAARNLIHGNTKYNGAKTITV